MIQKLLSWLCATNLVRMLLFSIQKIEVTQKKVEIKVSESSRIGSGSVYLVEPSKLVPDFFTNP